MIFYKADMDSNSGIYILTGIVTISRFWSGLDML